MEENTEQAVVEQTDDQATPETEEAGAQVEDELEKLLSEYDASETGASETEKPVDSGKATTVEDRLERIDQRLERNERRTEETNFRKDMDVAVKTVRGDLPGDLFDDTFMESWLDAQARQDPRIAQVWADRAQNPKRFDQVLTGLSRNFAKKFSNLPDAQATEDKEAVAAAVSGASKKAPEGKAPDYSKLTDQEYAEKVEKEHGFRPL